MDILKIIFPVSGVETYIFIPPVVAFIISFFCSMSGVTGAFLLLPFQMSILNFTSPSVSATNFVYNIVAIPGGVYRHIRENRMTWSLAAVITAGSIPGLMAGYYVRIKYLPDPHSFKLFAGIVLLYISARLLYNAILHSDNLNINQMQGSAARNADLKYSQIRTLSMSISKTEYSFCRKIYSFNTLALLLISLAVGVIGGAYGIGGGAIVAPVCIAIFRLPVYTTSGATLLSTFISSLIGVAVYSFFPIQPNMSTSPDWLLGMLFGIGGLTGVYFGIRCQKYVPQRLIKLLIGLMIAFVAFKYILQF